jgi:HK97 gp10 family phage protein
MQDGVIANITGLDELEEQLKELLPNQAKTAIRRAARAAGEIVMVQAEANAPELTGFLAHHIDETARTKEHTIVVKIGPAKDAGYFRGGQGAEHHLTFEGKPHMADQYARFAELGTVHQPATPFLGPALEEKADDVINVFVTELQDQIDKAKK